MSKKARALTAGVLFLALAVFYFVADGHIHHIICLPLLSLFAFSIGLLPWQMCAALFFCFLGDLAGSFKYTVPKNDVDIAFICQMGAFAVGHLFYIIYFLGNALRSKRNGRTKSRKKEGAGLFRGATFYMCCATFLTVAVVYVCLKRIIPCVASPAIATAMTCYMFIIALMMWCALMQFCIRHDGVARFAWILFAVGAVLFTGSDFTIAWSGYVQKVKGSHWFIMVPYYLAQIMIFYGAVLVSGKRVSGKA